MAELLLTDLDKIDDHPDNPRISFRQDVVDSIIANLNGEWPKQHALHVRPIADRYQIVSGHTRKLAACQRGLSHVWCWVEDMSDEDAFMCLVTENSQGELSPLEIGMHVLKAVPKEQGKAGGGLAAYAEKIGKTKQYVGQLWNAADVASTCKVDFTSVLDKAQHLTIIHRAPEETWPALCESMVEDEPDYESSWTVKHTEEIVADIRSNGTAGHETAKDAVKAASAMARLAHDRGTPATPHVSHNSGENEWYTPPEFIEAAREVMGGIDLDPASSKIAQRTVQAGTFYTKDDDGLTKDWVGRVWMNPPYSSELIGKFASKIVQERVAGNVSQAIVLVNNATETQWFQEMLCESSAVCLLKGRIKFLDKSGSPTGAPLQGQAVVYVGADVERFAAAFSLFGSVMFKQQLGAI